MALTPKETDRLLVFSAAELARRRLARGLRLNYPEAVAIITDEVFEAARDGRSFDEVVRCGMHALTREQVLEGVPEMIPLLHVDAMFADGSRLVTLVNPIGQP
jgi:urease subunit gamma